MFVVHVGGSAMGVCDSGSGEGADGEAADYARRDCAVTSLINPAAANEPSGMARRARHALASECSSGLQRGQWDKLCQLPEVIERGSQEELVSSTKWTSQPEPIETQDALEMCEQHIGLLPLTPRCMHV
jgi:hypothetical protein